MENLRLDYTGSGAREAPPQSVIRPRHGEPQALRVGKAPLMANRHRSISRDLARTPRVVRARKESNPSTRRRSCDISGLIRTRAKIELPDRFEHMHTSTLRRIFKAFQYRDFRLMWFGACT